MQKLDSIRRSNSISKYFADLYYKTTKNAFDFFLHSDEMTQAFMEKFEKRFGNFFFNAANSYKAGTEISIAWNAYYKDSSLSQAQYFLLGANAHINGDIWQSLTTEFSLQEIKDNKKSYFRFYKELKKIYSYVYKETLASSGRLRFLHHLTLGFDKLYGKIMLYKWRRRQMKLAVLFFTHPGQFKQELHKVRKKMNKMDKMIMQLI